jgi:hypothetical protein
MMLRLAGVGDSEKNKNEIEVADEDGVASVSNAKRMLKWLAEGVRRTLELDSGSDTAKDVSALLTLLLTSMGQVYIETSLDATADQALVQETAKTEPDLSYLPDLLLLSPISCHVSSTLFSFALQNRILLSDELWKHRQNRRLKESSKGLILLCGVPFS